MNDDMAQHLLDKLSLLQQQISALAQTVAQLARAVEDMNLKR